MADELDAALKSFMAEGSQAGLVALNGAWAKAHRVWLALPPEKDPAKPGGKRARALAA